MKTYFSDFDNEKLYSFYGDWQEASKNGMMAQSDAVKAALDEYRAKFSATCGYQLQSDLLSEIATRWYNEEKLNHELPHAGQECWYVDPEEGQLEKAVIENVEFKDGKVDAIGVTFPESSYFDDFDGTAWGHVLVATRAAAEKKMRGQ
jgi:hypothetical protein